MGTTTQGRREYRWRVLTREYMSSGWRWRKLYESPDEAVKAVRQLPPGIDWRIDRVDVTNRVWVVLH